MECSALYCSVIPSNDLTVGWSGEGSYLSVHVFDLFIFAVFILIDQSTSFPFAIVVTSSSDHQAIELYRPKVDPPCERVRLIALGGWVATCAISFL